MFKKIEMEDKTNVGNSYSSSKAEVIINESDTDDVFQSICATIITNIHKNLGKGSGWIIDSVIDHTISISKLSSIADIAFAKTLNFKDITFLVKINRKLKSTGIDVFGYENKDKYPIYASKNCCEEKHVDLLLIGKIKI